jgi:hypothetical protein
VSNDCSVCFRREKDNHSLGCHGSRISDRSLRGDARLAGDRATRIAISTLWTRRSGNGPRVHRDEWIDDQVFNLLVEEALDSYDRDHGSRLRTTAPAAARDARSICATPNLRGTLLAPDTHRKVRETPHTGCSLPSSPTRNWWRLWSSILPGRRNAS